MNHKCGSCIRFNGTKNALCPIKMTIVYKDDVNPECHKPKDLDDL